MLSFDDRIVEVGVFNLQKASSLDVPRIETRLFTQVPLLRVVLRYEFSVTGWASWMRDAHGIEIIDVQCRGNGTAVFVTLDSDGYVPELTFSECMECDMVGT